MKQVKLMRKDDRPSATNPSLPSSSVPSPESSADDLSRTLLKKEQDYQEARARIFGQSDPGKQPEIVSVPLPNFHVMLFFFSSFLLFFFFPL